MKICVIYAGISTERLVSISTAKQIINNLDRNKYEVSELRIDKPEDVFNLKDKDIDMVFIALHGKFGEDGKVQAILESMNIKYTGSGVLASAVCMDKDMSKKIARFVGVRTANWWTVRKGETFEYDKKYEELIIKPNSGGSSIGVHFIHNQKELNEALEDIFSMDNEAIIEEVIHGEEMTVPVILGKAYPTLKIEALKGTWFDYRSKYEDGGAKEYVAKLDENLEKELKEFSEKLFYETKCRGYIRIDYLVKDNKAYFMEINNLPGLTANSLLPKSLASLGISYREVLDMIIEASQGE